MHATEWGRFSFTPLVGGALVITELTATNWTEDVTVQDAGEAAFIVACLVEQFGAAIVRDAPLPADPAAIVLPEITQEMVDRLRGFSDQAATEFRVELEDIADALSSRVAPAAVANTPSPDQQSSVAPSKRKDGAK